MVEITETAAIAQLSSIGNESTSDNTGAFDIWFE